MDTCSDCLMHRELGDKKCNWCGCWLNTDAENEAGRHAACDAICAKGFTHSKREAPNG